MKLAAGEELWDPAPFRHWGGKKAQAAGVVLQFLSLFVSPDLRRQVPALTALERVERLYQEVARHPAFYLVRWRQDLAAAEAGSGLGLVLAFEGGEPLQGQLWLLHLFYRLGVRVVGLTWNLRNELGDGVEEERGAGLTGFGRRVVAEAGRLGMVVDVSHLSPAGFRDVAQRVAGPFMASHSNARALCPHPRNLSDGQLREIAAHQGWVGVNFCPEFLRDPADEAGLEDVVDHIAYVSSLIGPQFVGIGSDFDGVSHLPKGLAGVQDLPRLVDALQRKGFTPQEVGGIMGENLLAFLGRTLPAAPQPDGDEHGNV